MTIDQARGLFPGAAGFLNTAALGLPPRTATEALRAALARWERGDATPTDYDAAVAGSRHLFADLVHVPADWVTVGAQVSALVGLVAGSLEAGSHVLCVDDEFTSVTFPFVARSDLGLTVESVPPSALADAIGRRTSLVAVSAVQSKDGRVMDLAAVREAADGHGARVLVDATQAVGWLPLNAGDFDAVVVGAYKWLMSPRGTAFMSVRPELLESIHPLYAGWYAGDSPWDSIYGLPPRLASDARRLDLSPAWLSWEGTEPAVRLISELGVEAIHRHNVELANALLAGLDLGATDSAIVALDLPEGLPVDALKGIRASMRAGRLRVSFHLYNTMEDVDGLIAALRSR